MAIGIAYWYCLLAPVIPLWNNSTVFRLLDRLLVDLLWPAGWCFRRSPLRSITGLVGLTHVTWLSR